MGTLDIILLVCFIPSIVTGIRKGFIEQLVNLAAIVVSAWAAFKFSSLLADWMMGFMTVNGKVVQIIAFILIVVGVAWALVLLGKVISKTARALSIGWLDRLLGLLFSVFKTLLLIGIAISAFEGLNAQWHIVNPDVLDSSTVYVAIRNVSGVVLPFLKDLIANG